MSLRARILKVTQPDYGGPRARSVLEGLALPSEDFETTFNGMRARKELVRYRSRKGALYGPPGQKLAR